MRYIVRQSAFGSWYVLDTEDNPVQGRIGTVLVRGEKEICERYAARLNA